MVSGFQPVAPSAVPCELSGGYVPRPLTREEIAEIVDRFVAAALRGKRSRMDAIEIHGASGYLLNAFMSPYTNLREDEYGGSLANRMRFPLEVVRAVRDAIGDDMPLLYRMSGHDYVDGGLTETDTVPFAEELEQAGVDLIDVSAGTYESITATQPPMEAAPGGLLELAATIKAAVTIPVATAGKLGALDVAEQALGAGIVDFVSIARGLHADPELLLKAREGRLHEARRCIACAECVAFLNTDQPAYCAINPATSVNSSWRRRRPGPPGRWRWSVAALRASRRLAPLASPAMRNGLRGVVVLGGRVRQGAVARGRQDFAEPCGSWRERWIGSRSRSHLATRLTPSSSRTRRGRRHRRHRCMPHLAPIPGSDKTMSSRPRYWPVKRWTHRQSPQPAVVIGANWIGCHAADVLVTQGYSVTSSTPRIPSPVTWACSREWSCATVLRTRATSSSRPRWRRSALTT